MVFNTFIFSIVLNKQFFFLERLRWGLWTKQFCDKNKSIFTKKVLCIPSVWSLIYVWFIFYIATFNQWRQGFRNILRVQNLRLVNTLLLKDRKNNCYATTFFSYNKTPCHNDSIKRGQRMHIMDYVHKKLHPYL